MMMHGFVLFVDRSTLRSTLVDGLNKKEFLPSKIE